MALGNFGKIESMKHALILVAVVALLAGCKGPIACEENSGKGTDPSGRPQALPWLKCSR